MNLFRNTKSFVAVTKITSTQIDVLYISELTTYSTHIFFASLANLLNCNLILFSSNYRFAESTVPFFYVRHIAL